MYQIGSKIPTAVRSAVLTRAASTASLAQDADVAAVLAANPHAAAIEMGTVFRGLAAGPATSNALDKIRAAVEISLGKQLPAQVSRRLEEHKPVIDGWLTDDLVNHPATTYQRDRPISDLTPSLLVARAHWNVGNA